MPVDESRSSPIKLWDHGMRVAACFEFCDRSDSITLDTNGVFAVLELDDCDLPEFKHFARSDGHAFDPPVELADLEWFAELRKKLANFRVGLQHVSEQDHVGELVGLARWEGFGL